MDSWTHWHDRLHQVLRHRHLLHKQQRVLLAVSGGQDSLCLARLMLDLQSRWGWQLAIAHANHQWRPDADANAAHVQKLAATWQLPYFGVTTSSPPGSEAAAREWRYENLAAIAHTHEYSAVVTGHTASDRAETLLYNLFRGSGSDGLQALTWQRELSSGVQLVRPLLEFTRSETTQICQTYQLEVWEDSTNQDVRYARNRIRHELLPYLKTHVNPQIELTLCQTAELLRADTEFLEAIATRLHEQSLAPDSSPRLNRQSLHDAPLAVQRRTLRQFLRDRLPVAPTFQDIEKLRHLIDAPNRSQTDPFPGGAIAQVEGEWIKLVP